MRKPVFGVCDQVRLKPACSATETSHRLEISDIETRDIILSRQWTTKVLIRLCIWLKQVLSWCGSYGYQNPLKIISSKWISNMSLTVMLTPSKILVNYTMTSGHFQTCMTKLLLLYHFFSNNQHQVHAFLYWLASLEYYFRHSSFYLCRKEFSIKLMMILFHNILDLFQHVKCYLQKSVFPLRPILWIHSDQLHKQISFIICFDFIYHLYK